VIDFPVALKDRCWRRTRTRACSKNKAIAQAMSTFFRQGVARSADYQTQATVSTQMYPAGELPAGMAMDN